MEYDLYKFVQYERAAFFILLSAVSFVDLFDFIHEI
jgi:hypothetical protein